MESATIYTLLSPLLWVYLRLAPCQYFNLLSSSTFFPWNEIGFLNFLTLLFQLTKALQYVKAEHLIIEFLQLRTCKTFHSY